MRQLEPPPARISVWPIVERLQSLAGGFEAVADEHAEDLPTEIAVLLSHCHTRLQTLSDFISAVDRRQFVTDEMNSLNHYLDVVQICARLKTWTGPEPTPLTAVFHSCR